jgi:hypothetical protein
MVIRVYQLGMFTRGFLSELRLKAVRRRVLFRALDGVERGILYLCTRVVDKVSNPVLGVQLVKIVSKLLEAFKGEFTKHIESYGYKRIVQIVKQATSMGCNVAYRWLSDMGFIRYLSFLDFNQPIGYR